ncbi:MAG: hypothetical protein RLZZ414_2147 [Bacteroidota bacterium]|jgi:hypothetical protein
MKKISTLFVAAAIALSATTVVSCKSKKKTIEPPKGETEITIPCSGSEFFSDKKHFRSNSLGESSDRATAIKKAESNAKSMLASYINTHIKTVTDNYVNSREFNNKEQVEERFESLAREVVDQQITGVRKICEKLTQKQDGQYVYYVAFELGTDDLVSKINERITKDEALRVDYDYEQFKKTFDEEMEKRSKR